jgi:hypothetical protein
MPNGVFQLKQETRVDGHQNIDPYTCINHRLQPTNSFLKILELKYHHQQLKLAFSYCNNYSMYPGSGLVL